eukprot:TRINITY_DN13434_c0_g1_i1.p1 TRINITY_DN13434_c0_g1~~TRINITY_DN13434_c0_g1_i1.p1  ORF type:complete len:569 (+),score=186.17 TRINITY_DN13434_c0_g1_i1:40-1746(+)
MESPASDSGLDSETKQQTNLASNTMEDLSLQDDDEAGTEIPLDDDTDDILNKQPPVQNEVTDEADDLLEQVNLDDRNEDNDDEMFQSARQEQSIAPGAGIATISATTTVTNGSTIASVGPQQPAPEREVSVETDIPLEDDEDTYTSPYLELSSGAAPGSNPAQTMTSFRDLNSGGMMMLDELGEEYIQITVTSPHKVGDGISSYMAYTVKTHTNLSYFKKKDNSVTRRFSDFLGLRDKLGEKYLQNGRIIPPAPDKSVLGMTKIKLAKEEDNADQYTFVEKRRAALERYLNRTAQHPSLRVDPDFREFLELDAELPKSSQTSTLSSKSVMRMISKVGEKVVNYAVRMDETDQWFHEKTVMIDRLDDQLRKLMYATENLVFFRKSLTGQSYSVAKSLQALGTTEENVKISTALDKLSEVFIKVEKVHDEQSKDDFFLLSEMIHDYIGIVGAVKDALRERVKAWQAWQSLQEELNKKREAKVKGELAGKLDKVNDMKAQIQDTERQLDMAQENFEKISNTIKKEFNMFEARKCQDFKQTIVNYLERMLKAQECLAAHWEAFKPEMQQLAL